MRSPGKSIYPSCSQCRAQQEGLAAAIAVGSNVLERLPVREDETQHAAAQRLVDRAIADAEPVQLGARQLLPNSANPPDG